MKLDLSDVNLFVDNSIDFDKKVNYIYGPNGTGKTTISDILKQKSNEYDVHVFQGFDSVISDRDTLNAIVLGSKNVEISAKIDEIDKILADKKNEIKKIKETVSEPKDSSIKNYWTTKNEKVKKYNSMQNQIDSIFSSCASEIKKMTNPQIVKTNYNKTNFKNDISNAKLLEQDEIKVYRDTINAPIKKARTLSAPVLNEAQLQTEVNNLISFPIKEPLKIQRIDNPEKRKFAEYGRRIHKKGDCCAFCGNRIDDDVFNQLDEYFSSSDIRDYQNKLREKIYNLNNFKQKLNDLDIEIDDFYPEYISKAKELKEKLITEKDSYISFVNNLIDALDNKNKNLFESTTLINMELPNDLSHIINDYNELKNKNNESSLEVKQQSAKDMLKLHYVKQKLIDNNYERLLGQLQELENQKNEAIRAFQNVENQISEGSQLINELKKLENERFELEKQTVSETLLVDNINSKIRKMVSFTLHHQKNDFNKGIYNIKDNLTGEIRPINELSTGEKNIIAFLYFIEKINEINPNSITNKPKLVVFDDPMNSNDDNMQYLIMDEITRLRKSLSKYDVFILLTHNKHFYINISYDMNKDRAYKHNNFFHFISINNRTQIIKIQDKSKDFCTSYDSLWKELRILYDYKEASSELLINPIRRILETYLKFNVIKADDFYIDIRGAKKLFDVNSHSIDDLEAELNGKTKRQLVDLLKECFSVNNAESHFDLHWNKNE